MELALHVLRGPEAWRPVILASARRILCHGSPDLVDLADMVNASEWVELRTGDRGRRRHYRILRARLALYLRAVLRMEAGDFGYWWRWDGAAAAVRLARPLWLDAKSHQEGR
jgi:hypothetical protein